MVRDAVPQKKIRLIGILGLFGILTGLVLWSGTGKDSRLSRGQTAGGDARLTSIQPLPEMDDGEMCPVVTPASANTSLFAELSQQQQESAAVPAQGTPSPYASEALRAAMAKRKPDRMIQDPNPAFSAVALDAAHDEVILQDENTFGINVYNRLDNTPPRARMTEPKRSIRGENTHVDFNCQLYVDPMNGDIYSVNNDTLGILTIFGHDAKGDAAPKRMLQTGGMYGVAVDEEAQEMFLSSQAGGVVIYKKMAQGHDRPIRRIQGNNKQMADSHGMAIDQKKGLIFVANWGTGMKHEPFTPGAAPAGGGDEGGGGPRETPGSGFFQPPSITVFPKDAKGDVAPLRVIQGSKTQMNWPTAVAVDPEHGEIYVANDTGHSITVYSEDANGDVAPIRVIKGPKSQIVNPHGLAYDTKHGELFVANFGNHAATVYSRTANGDAAPLRIIRATPLDTPTPMMGNPHTVVYDGNREQILVGD